jgi:hypothetical protein
LLSFNRKIIFLHLSCVPSFPFALSPDLDGSRSEFSFPH